MSPVRWVPSLVVVFGWVAGSLGQERSASELRNAIYADDVESSRMVLLVALGDRADAAECTANTDLISQLLERATRLASAPDGTPEAKKSYLDAKTAVYLLRELYLNQSSRRACNDEMAKVLVDLARSSSRWVKLYLPDVLEDIFTRVADEGLRRSLAWAVLCANPADARTAGAAARVWMDSAAFTPTIALQARELWEVSRQSGRPNLGVLFLLADRGDQTILPSVRSLLQSAEAENAGSALVIYLRDSIWRIEVQQSPTTMKRFLESGVADERVEWVVRRAVEEGWPRAELRASIGQYYRRCPRKELPRMRAAGLDRVVLLLGLMTRAELPGGFVPPAPNH